MKRMVWSVLIVVSLWGANVYGQDYAQAETVFAQGKLLLETGDYNRALFALKKAYSILPSPKYLKYIAIAYRKQGKVERAVIYAERYLKAVSKQEADPEFAAWVKTKIQELSADHAKLIMRVKPVGGILKIVFSDGSELKRVVDESPYEMWAKAGTVTMKYSKAGYQELSAKVTLEPGREALFTISLEPIVGTSLLVVDSNVEQAAVFVDGKQVGTTPLRYSIKSGRHIVQVWRQNYLPYEAVLDLPAGKTTVVKAELVAAGVDLKQLPRLHLKYEEPGGFSQTTWGWLTIVLASGGAGVAGYFYYQMYNAATLASQYKVTDPEYKQLSNEASQYWLYAVIAGGASAAVAGLGLYLILTDDSSEAERDIHFQILGLAPRIYSKGLGLDAVLSF